MPINSMEKKMYDTPQTIMVAVEADSAFMEVSQGGNYITTGDTGKGNAGTLGNSSLNIRNVWDDEEERYKH